ncbi:hypothetical protein ACFV6U_24075, partial [Streptomyces sp. NPDC059810]|uniref:hypothetical protein n=1 Tax=Streptomyces sp. NPDC059810 TaxID=3346956 RepID=UPI00365D7B72
VRTLPGEQPAVDERLAASGRALARAVVLLPIDADELLSRAPARADTAPGRHDDSAAGSVSTPR